MTTANEEILNNQVRHSIAIERFKDGTLRKMISLLNKAEDDLVEKIAGRLARIEKRGFDLGKDTTKRLNKLLSEVKEQREALYIVLRDELKIELDDFAIEEALFQVKMTEAAVKVELNRTTAARLKAITVSQPFRGRILRDWAGNLARNDVRRIQDAIKVGVVEGQTTDQIIRAVTGTKAQRYKNGILEISRREASAVVRTAVAHVNNRAREEVWQANKDIVKGVQWVSTLDGRTSAICRARDNEVYPVSSGPRPPSHFNCRSIVVAYFGKVQGQRASAIGPVPASVSYGDWLRAQPTAVQNEVLGKTKAQLFRKGGLKIDRFVDKTGKELTLAELRTNNKEIYDKVIPAE